jgi:hypothetical protein
MSILNDRNYEDSILRDGYGHILILTVTEYGAKKNHMVQCLGKSVAGPANQGYTSCDWPRQIGESLSDMVNYCHKHLEISVITKLYLRMKL